MVLEGLREGELPQGEAVPLNLVEVASDARASVHDPRGWEALIAFTAHREALEVTALRFNVTRERVRRMQDTALWQLRAYAKLAPWADVLHDLAQQPHAVVIPHDMEDVWPVQVLAALSPTHPNLRTVRLADGVWALFCCETWRDARLGELPPGRYCAEDEAARQLRISAELLRVAWPAMMVRRTRSGAYVGPQDRWSSAAWLAAVAYVLAQAGHDTWEERLLFAAVRSLPGAPNVQDATFRRALRTGREFSRTGLSGVWRCQAPAAS